MLKHHHQQLKTRQTSYKRKRSTSVSTTPSHAVSAQPRVLSLREVLYEISAIEFGVKSPQEIRRISVTQVNQPIIYRKFHPQPGGINDVKMGTVDRRLECGTCKGRVANCMGHTGHMDLPIPLYNINFLDKVLKILRSVCYWCSQLLIPPVDWETSKPKDKKQENQQTALRVFWKTWQEAERQQHGLQDMSHSVNMTRFDMVCTEAFKYDKCWHCRGVVPTYKLKGLTIHRIWPEDMKWEDKNEENAGTCMFTAAIARQILQAMSDETCEKMGFDVKKTRPEWFITTVLEIPPPCVRPSIMASEGSKARGQDDLTRKLQDLLKLSLTYSRLLSSGKTKNNPLHKDVLKVADEMQYSYGVYLNNDIKNVQADTQRSGAHIRGIRQRVNGKDGITRGNMMGKRVDQASRTVISCDPSLDIDEVGVPVCVAATLTFPEVVTLFNIKDLSRRVLVGAHDIHGADRIEYADGREISLEACANRHLLSIPFGCKVHRYLKNGDWVLFNRHPSLHKQSLMAHRVRILPMGKTFRMHPSVCPPYNADFDGDEMNIHSLQSFEAVAEAKELLAVPKHVLSAKSNRPVMGVIQDGVLAGYLFTRKDVWLNREQVMLLLSQLKSPPPGKSSVFHLPVPAIIKPSAMWSGKQLVSYLLPTLNLERKVRGLDTHNYLDYEERLVCIRRGHLLTGALCKSTLGASSGSIIHILALDYSGECACQFMGDFQRLLNWWFAHRGFSIGVDDFITDPMVNADVQTTIRRALLKTLEITDKVSRLPNLPAGSAEPPVFQTLNSVLNFAGGHVTKAMSDKNSIYCTATSGSKGSKINISQLSACVGQQSIDGKRVHAKGINKRTLNCFDPRDRHPRTQGFVTHSYTDGLTPTEFFFHAMGGREGLIDTSIKSVRGTTEIVVMIHDQPLRTTIGQWIDRELQLYSDQVRYYSPQQANMEWLNVEHMSTFVPTVNERGKVSWGQVTAITRHDPGEWFYRVQTKSGRAVTVVESQSLLVWDPSTSTFQPVNSSQVTTQHALPVTAYLSEPLTLSCYIQVADYWPEFHTSDKRQETFELNYRNGVFMGLYLADGYGDDVSGIIMPTSHPTISSFVCQYFHDLGIPSHSSWFATFIGRTLGVGAADKRLPAEAYTAPRPFLLGLLNGYISANGHVTDTSLTLNSMSYSLMEGMAWIFNRLGAFCQLGKGIEHSMHQIEVGLPWLGVLAPQLHLLHLDKDQVMRNIGAIGVTGVTGVPLNDQQIQDVVLDPVLSVEKFPTQGEKVYDLTVPSTFNFGLANGLMVRDTADCGYLMRRMMKAMESLTSHADQSVRDAQGHMVQFLYGGDGMDAQYLEHGQTLDVIRWSSEKVKEWVFGTWGSDHTPADPSVLQDEYQNLITLKEQVIREKYHVVVPDIEPLVYLPMSIPRIIAHVKQTHPESASVVAESIQHCPASPSYDMDDQDESKLNATQVYQEVQDLVHYLQTSGCFTERNCLFMKTLLCTELTVHRILYVHGLTRFQWDQVQAEIKRKWDKCLIPTGEMVGKLAGESIGEGNTQGTLNVFHYSGVAGKNVTLGMFRLKELIDVTKKMKLPSLTVFLKEPWANLEHAAEDLCSTLPHTYLEDVVEVIDTIYEPDLFHTTLTTDETMVAQSQMFYADLAQQDQVCSWVIRMELSRHILLTRHYTIVHIAKAIKAFVGPYAMVLHTAPSSLHWIIRVRLIDLSVLLKKPDLIQERSHLDQTITTSLQNLLLKRVVIGGLECVRKANIRQIRMSQVNAQGQLETVPQWIIDTEGNGLREIGFLPAVDWYRTYSNDVREVCEVLGIEAAAQILFHEIANVLSFDGSYINPRHMMMLVNVMTCRGTLMPVNRFGMNRQAHGSALSKISFEEQMDVTLDAATFNQKDQITDVSARIITGRQPNIGTRAFGSLISTQDPQSYLKSEPATSHLKPRIWISRINSSWVPWKHSPPPQQPPPQHLSPQQLPPPPPPYPPGQRLGLSENNPGQRLGLSENNPGQRLGLSENNPGQRLGLSENNPGQRIELSQPPPSPVLRSSELKVQPVWPVRKAQPTPQVPLGDLWHSSAPNVAPFYLTSSSCYRPSSPNLYPAKSIGTYCPSSPQLIPDHSQYVEPILSVQQVSQMLNQMEHKTEQKASEIPVDFDPTLFDPESLHKLQMTLNDYFTST